MTLLREASKSPISNVGDVLPTTPNEVVITGLTPKIAAVQIWAEQPGNHVDLSCDDPSDRLLRRAFGLTISQAKKIIPTDPRKTIPLSKVLSPDKI